MAATAYLLPTALTLTLYFPLPTSYFLLPNAYVLPSTFCVLLKAFCLMLNAYRLPLTAYRLMLFAFCFLLSNFCFLSFIFYLLAFSEPGAVEDHLPPAHYSNGHVAGLKTAAPLMPPFWRIEPASQQSSRARSWL